MEEHQLSLGIEAGGYFTAGRGYSLKVMVGNGYVTFVVSGERTAKTDVPAGLIVPLVGALDYIGNGMVSRKEVIGDLYVEKGKTFGRARIRVKKPDGDKVFTEIPIFEASSIASYILSRVSLPGIVRYGIMDYSLEVSPVHGEEKIAFRAYSPEGSRATVFDIVGFSKILAAVRNAALGSLYTPIRITGLVGYVVVQEYIETEEPGKEEEVKRIVQEVTRAAQVRNVPPTLLAKEALKKQGIRYKHVVRLRVGKGEEGENRLEIRIPPAHAWGLTRVGEKVIEKVVR